MALEIEKLTKRKSELENLLKSMEGKEENLEEAVKILIGKLRNRELNRKIRMKRDILHHYESGIKTLEEQNDGQKQVHVQHTLNPIQTIETKILEKRLQFQHHRVRLRRNTIFSWSYQKLS
ncbi:hypothetical protein E3J51_01900 [Candidatus Bathyarchaeota archaeon]|nr:MAG: hypothetical protein E3J51_01900 [Candidatus Bathyarchaeota archaeon]